MKKIYLLIVLFGVCVMLKAQESQLVSHSRENNKLLQLNIGVGTNFDLLHKGGDNSLVALSDRKSPFPVIDFRLEHFFSKRWGWFGDIKLGIPDRYRTDYYSKLVNTFEADYYVNNYVYDKQKPSVSPSLIVGAVYRIENPRWAFYPRLGVGVNTVSLQDVFMSLKKRGGNQLYEIRCGAEGGYRQESMDIFVLSAGISVNYKLSTDYYLFLNTSYTQPIGVRSSFEYVKIDLYTKKVIERQIYKTSTLGRNLNVSIGIGLPIHLGKRSKKDGTTRKERMQRIMEQKRKSYGLFPTTKK